MIIIKNLLIILTWIAWSHCVAQTLTLSKPWDKSIFQRANDNTGYLPIEGTCTGTVNAIEARLTPVLSGQGTAVDWTIIAYPIANSFKGSIKASGGWYKLEVRSKSGAIVVVQTSIAHVGLGEIFYNAGQSNAQGFSNPGILPAQDDRVNCIQYSNYIASNPPVFQKATGLIGPRGDSPWCWGLVGDSIAKRYNVPVLLINAAVNGSAAYQWSDAIKTTPATSPYSYLEGALGQWGTILGGRGILWVQGEADGSWVNWFPDQKAYYIDALTKVINKSRVDINKSDFAWAIARVSFDHSENYVNDTTWNSGIRRAKVIAAQNEIIATVNGVFQGPYNDSIPGEIGSNTRGDGVHFNDNGHLLHAQGWIKKLNKNFFTKSNPKLPTYTLVTATDSDSPEQSYSVFPNPSTGIFTISLPEKSVQITVVNMEGKRVISIPSTVVSNNSYSLDLSGYPDGIYIVEIHSSVAIYHHQISKNSNSEK